MTRIVALVAGLLLIGCPAWWLREVTVPVPAYRKGGYVDFLFLGQTLLAIYGSVLLGIVVHCVRANRSGQTLFPFVLFKAGMRGVLVICIVFFGGGIVYGLTKYGAFEKAIGENLWGLLVVFWAILGATYRLVSRCYFTLGVVRRDTPARCQEAADRVCHLRD